MAADGREAPFIYLKKHFRGQYSVEIQQIRERGRKQEDHSHLPDLIPGEIECMPPGLVKVIPQSEHDRLIVTAALHHWAESIALPLPIA
ncbi:MAG: hypothetical protein AAGF66_14100 [Cyanobacteria bacterium P01_H01_bin.119]